MPEDLEYFMPEEVLEVSELLDKAVKIRQEFNKADFVEQALDSVLFEASEHIYKAKKFHNNFFHRLYATVFLAYLENTIKEQKLD